MIEVKDLTKCYGTMRGIKNLNFTVNKGEVIGLLGPNGAGKSTTMNILTGYKSPTGGKVIIDGFNVFENPLEAKKRIGYLPEIPPLYPELQVYSYLRFVCELKGVRKEKRDSHIKKIMELVKISDVKDRLIMNLSKGYKQRVGLAQALISNPDVLFLDEPTVGLDPKQITEIRSLVKGLGKEHTIILSSHILAEVSMICERVIIINKGVIVAQGTPDNLAKGLVTSGRFLIKVKGPAESIKNIIQNIDGVISIEDNIAEENLSDGFYDYIVENDKSADVKAPLIFALAREGYPIHEVRSMELSLEDIFLQLTNENQNKEGVQ